ncbi:MAG: hypothetical protein K2Y37_01340 [Pirellulales bacterium]|nr:hypothetical protein [Pirellulales bacterium]
MVNQEIVFKRIKGDLVVNGWVVTNPDGTTEQCVTIAHRDRESWFAMTIRREELVT